MIAERQLAMNTERQLAMIVSTMEDSVQDMHLLLHNLRGTQEDVNRPLVRGNEPSSPGDETALDQDGDATMGNT